MDRIPKKVKPLNDEKPKSWNPVVIKIQAIVKDIEILFLDNVCGIFTTLFDRARKKIAAIRKPKIPTLTPLPHKTLPSRKISLFISMELYPVRKL